MVRIVAVLLLLAGLFALPSRPASAQTYPSRVVTIIVMQSAGGLSDVIARSFASALQERFGQPFIIENRPGANGMTGGRACADARPDGYTICILSTDPPIWNELMFKSVPFHPEKSFAPVTNLFAITGVLGINASLQIKTLKELITYSKANPGKVAYATTSSIANIFMEQFKRDTGADLVGVPFKGGGEAVSSVLSGHTPLGIFGLGNFVPYLKTGQIIALAKDGTGRLKDFPDIPTFREAGYDGDRARSWFGVFAPAGTPEPIIRLLNKAFNEIAAPAEFQQKQFYLRGLEPALTTPEGFAKEIAAERETARRIVKAAGLEPQ